MAFDASVIRSKRYTGGTSGNKLSWPEYGVKPFRKAFFSLLFRCKFGVIVDGL